MLIKQIRFFTRQQELFVLKFKHYGFVLLALLMHSVILIWITNVQSHFMHPYAVLHVQKNICMGGLGRRDVMRDTIIDVLELLINAEI